MTNKINSMQRILNYAFAATVLLVLAACGGKNDQNAQIAKKKEELNKLKQEQTAINDKITALEKELAKIDTSFSAAKPKLVTISPIGTDTFTHYIDLQGKIDAQNVAMVAPQGQGGVVKQVLVKQGQQVRKGQAILRLDNSVAQQQVDQARQQIAGQEANVKLLQSIYERQQNLWKNNIGTEVQVLQAKTNMEAAQSQLAAARAAVRTAQEVAGQGTVTAEIGGTIDVVNVRVGEFFSPQSAANPATGIRIVNTGDLKVLVQVPENYLDRVNVGANLKVTLPEAGNKVINTKVSVAGKLIDPNTRSFYAEAKLPQDKALRPNQLALIQIQDYAAPSAITIPVNTLQNDEKGKFVMVAVKDGNKMVARKKPVTVGELYGEKLEVKSGLTTGDQVITDGFQGLYDGQTIMLATN